MPNQLLRMLEVWLQPEELTMTCCRETQESV
ncbi:hypothetical protein NFI96_022496 [Prochilodus magdalenae]|nr:hypothetical protein NFI96_022496 [Prochilodus magdalenae]